MRNEVCCQLCKHKFEWTGKLIVACPSCRTPFWRRTMEEAAEMQKQFERYRESKQIKETLSNTTRKEK